MIPFVRNMLSDRCQKIKRLEHTSARLSASLRNFWEFPPSMSCHRRSETGDMLRQAQHRVGVRCPIKDLVPRRGLRSVAVFCQRNHSGK
jgi:hypothetical protein